MIEVRGNLWTFKVDAEAGACAGQSPRLLRCITTNGATRRDGAAVMGRGCALEAKEKMPGIEYRLGELLGEHGNRVFRLGALADGSHVASFPVKHHWKQLADLDLIERSSRQLVELADKFGYRALVPRPGCGNGALAWHDVRPVLEQVLVGERFVVITH